MHSNRRIYALLIEAESWIKQKRDITEFHNAMCFACLLEAKVLNEITKDYPSYPPKRERKAPILDKRTVAGKIASTLAENPSLVDEL